MGRVDFGRSITRQVAVTFRVGFWEGFESAHGFLHITPVLRHTGMLLQTPQGL